MSRFAPSPPVADSSGASSAGEGSRGGEGDAVRNPEAERCRIELPPNFVRHLRRYFECEEHDAAHLRESSSQSSMQDDEDDDEHVDDEHVDDEHVAGDGAVAVVDGGAFDGDGAADELSSDNGATATSLGASLNPPAAGASPWPNGLKGFRKVLRTVEKYNEGSVSFVSLLGKVTDPLFTRDVDIWRDFTTLLPIQEFLRMARRRQVDPTERSNALHWVVRRRRYLSPLYYAAVSRGTHGGSAPPRRTASALEDEIRAVYEAFPMAIQQHNHFGSTPMHYAAWFIVDDDLGRNLVRNLFLQNHKEVASVRATHSQSTPLHFAMRGEALRLSSYVDRCFEADGDEKCRYCQTHRSTAMKDLDAACPWVHRRNVAGETAWSLYEAFPQAIKHQNREGDTPLHVGMYSGILAALPCLSRGILGSWSHDLVPVTNSQGNTLLHMAVSGSGECRRRRYRHWLWTNRKKRQRHHQQHAEGVDNDDDYGFIPVVSYLLRRWPSMARVNNTEDFMVPPLHHALKAGASSGVIRALLRAYPEATERRCSSGGTALHFALTTSDPHPYDAALIRMLLNTSPNRTVTYRTNDNATPLYIGAYFGADTEVLRLIYERNRDAVYVGYTDEQDSPLHGAIRFGTVTPQVVRTFATIPDAADSDEADRPLHPLLHYNVDGSTPLHLALRLSFDRCLEQRRLYRHKCPPVGIIPTVEDDASDDLENGWNEDWNGIANLPEIVRTLLQVCPEATIVRDNSGNIPLHIAAALAAAATATSTTGLQCLSPPSTYRSFSNTHPINARQRTRMPSLNRSQYNTDIDVALDVLDCVLRASPPDAVRARNGLDEARNGDDEEIGRPRTPLQIVVAGRSDMRVVQMMLRADLFASAPTSMMRKVMEAAFAPLGIDRGF